MIDALANCYPGHRALDLFVIVAATATLLSAAGVAVSLCVGRRPAVQHAVLLSALVAALASPLFALGFVASGRSLVRVPLLAVENAQATQPRLSGEDRSAREVPGASRQGNMADSRAGQVAAGSSAQGGVAASIPSAAEPARTPAVELIQCAAVVGMFVWMCGSLIVTLGLLRSAPLLVRLGRSVQPHSAAAMCAFDEARELLGARGLPLVGESRLALAPLAAGLVRPAIVLPMALSRSMSHAELRDVFLHELAHIERGDQRVTLLQGIARALFWPIPCVHWLNRQLERAREEVCDNHVLACRNAVSYGETLLRVAELACFGALPGAAVGILQWRGKLEDRIIGLIDTGRSKMTRMQPLLAATVTAVFLSASALLCGTTFVQADSGPPPAAAHAKAPQPQVGKPAASAAAAPAATAKGSAKAKKAARSPQEEAALDAALDALAGVYALKSGEVLKGFSRPFPPQRGAYLDAMLPELPHAAESLDGYTWIIFNWNDRLKYKGAIHHSNPAGLGRRLLDVLTGLLDCPEQEIEGDQALLSKGVAADFVVREQASPQEVVAKLAEILHDQFHLAVKITVKEAERDVFVLKGKYKNQAAMNRLEIYGHEIINPDQGGGGEGSFREMVGHVGDWSKCRVVTEVEDATQQVAWHFNWRAPLTKETLAQDQNPQSVMKHLGEQTGLTVSQEKRRVRVFLVEALK